jgi:hypothetical protein
MRVTINFKGELGELLAQAKEMSGIENTSAVCNAALKELVEREKARRLRRLVNPNGRAKLPKRRYSK